MIQRTGKGKAAKQTSPVSAWMAALIGISAALLPFVASWWLVGFDSASMMPLWFGILFWGGLLTPVITVAWSGRFHSWSAMGAAPMLLTIFRDVRTNAYWPSRLLIDQPAGLFACFIAGLLMLAALPLFRARGTMKPWLAARRLEFLAFDAKERWKHGALTLVAIAALGVAAVYTAHASVFNLLWWQPGLPQTRSFPVIESHVERHGGRHPYTEIWVAVATPRGGVVRLDLDDLLQVATLGQKNQPGAQNSGLSTECIDALKAAAQGDVVVLQGRTGWAGFAVDGVESIEHGGSLCRCRPPAAG